MFEADAVYNLVTYVGNCVSPIKVAPLYSKEAGGNSDTYQKYRERKKLAEELRNKQDRWFADTKTLAGYIQYNLKGNWTVRKRAALSFFIRSDEWIDVFLKEVFGSKEAAFWKTETRYELQVAYMDWFEKKRKELRTKMKDNMITKECNIALTKKGKTTGTHGGVANLLKTLTKTMEKQGADIRSIAKVQYTICMQAGIYIPDEFIEDVAVIMNAEGDL